MKCAFRALLLALSALASAGAFADEPPIPGVKPPPPPVHRRAPDYPHTWPPYGGPAVIPAPPIPIPPPPSTNDLTRGMERDRLQGQIDSLRQQDALGRLDPLGRRDLLMKEQDLHQLNTDPLR